MIFIGNSKPWLIFMRWLSIKGEGMRSQCHVTSTKMFSASLCLITGTNY